MIVDWAGEHKDFVVGFFGAIAAVVAAIYLPAMIAAAAATLAATWPILAIGVAIVAAAAAFALIYDDIMNFIAGNDSMIGQIFEKYPMIKEIVFGLIDAFKQMGSAVGAVFEFIGEMWKLQFDFIMQGVEMIKSGLSSVGSFFGIGGDVDVSGANAQIAAASANPMNAVEVARWSV